EWKPIGTRRRPSLLFSQQDMRDSLRHARTGWTGVVPAPESALNPHAISISARSLTRRIRDRAAPLQFSLPRMQAASDSAAVSGADSSISHKSCAARKVIRAFREAFPLVVSLILDRISWSACAM